MILLQAILLTLFVLKASSRGGEILGIIGKTVEEIKELDHLPPGSGGYSGCTWRGRAPLCQTGCNVTEQSFRSAYMSDEPGFGYSCWFGQKSFCCHTDGADPTWTGTWISGHSSDLYHCQYMSHHPIMDRKGYKRCGALHCYSKRNIWQGRNEPGIFNETGIITGQTCRRLVMGEEFADVFSGVMKWEWEKKDIDQWYKVRFRFSDSTYTYETNGSFVLD